MIDMIESVSPQTLPPGETVRKRRRLSSMASESPRELGHMRRRQDTGSATFVGSGSGIHFVRTVRQAFARNSRRPSLNHDSNDDELVPGEDDQQRLPGLLWRGDEVLFPIQNQEHELPTPSFDNLVRWTKSYFTLWHPLYPFLHAPTFLGLLERISVHSLATLDHTERVIVCSVVSISTADRRQAPIDGESLVPAGLLFQSIEEAVSALQPLLLQPSSLPVLQAAVSIQLFLISMLRLNTASRIGGMIVRMLYHLGLHRCSSRFPQFSSMEVEIRRRLFWSIYCIERYLSQALGQPLELKDDDLDVCFPDEELHMAGQLPDPDARDNSRLMLATALAKHGKIKGLILELRNKSILHSRTDVDGITYIDAEISKWWNDTQELLDPILVNESVMWDAQESETIVNGNTSPRRLGDSHKLLLLVQKQELVLLLNRPVITSGSNTPAHASAIQKCIGASKTIISNIHRHMSKEMKADGAHNGRIHDPLVWPGIVWLIWQSGLILLYAAFEGHYSIQVAQRETDCCVTILQNLALRGNFWPSACGAAIKELQTSLYEKVMDELSPGHSMPETSYGPIELHKAASWVGTSVSNNDLSRLGQDEANNKSKHQTRTTVRGNSSIRHSTEASDKPVDSWQTPQYTRASTGTSSRTRQTPRDERSTSNQRNEGADYSMFLPDQNSRAWHIGNGQLNNSGDMFNNVFDDVFQYMDMPYTLNDPLSQAQLGVFDIPGHPSSQSMNVPGRGVYI